jgi:hypothetical protein
MTSTTPIPTTNIINIPGDTPLLYFKDRDQYYEIDSPFIKSQPIPSYEYSDNINRNADAIYRYYNKTFYPGIVSVVKKSDVPEDIYRYHAITKSWKKPIVGIIHDPIQNIYYDDPGDLAVCDFSKKKCWSRYSDKIFTYNEALVLYNTKKIDITQTENNPYLSNSFSEIYKLKKILNPETVFLAKVNQLPEGFTQIDFDPEEFTKKNIDPMIRQHYD